MSDIYIRGCCWQRKSQRSREGEGEGEGEDETEWNTCPPIPFRHGTPIYIIIYYISNVEGGILSILLA